MAKPTGWVDKLLASDPVTEQISDAVKEAFAEEKRCPSQADEMARQTERRVTCASAAIELATKEEAEKLLCAQFQGKDVTLHGLSLKVSPTFPPTWKKH